MPNDPANEDDIRPPEESAGQPRWRSAWNEALEASKRDPRDAAGEQRAHEAFAPPDDHPVEGAAVDQAPASGDAAASAGEPLSAAEPERAPATEAFASPDDHPVYDEPIAPAPIEAPAPGVAAAPVGAPLSTAEPERAPAAEAFAPPDDHPADAPPMPVPARPEPTAAYAAEAAEDAVMAPVEPASRWGALPSTDRLRELYRSPQPSGGGAAERGSAPRPAAAPPTAGDPGDDDEEDVVLLGSGPRVTYVDAFDRDRYADVPASLELAYTPADVGLSARAYERAVPYETIERQRRSTSGTRARRVGRELVETVILALLIFFAVKAVVQNFRVEGSSMEPSMHNNQYLLVNKALYFRVNLDKVHDYLPFIPGDDGQERHVFRAPRRGDVIVFRFPLDPSRDFIKRVIGAPGDTIEVKDETVFVNGSPLKEDYIKEKPNYTYAAKTVPPGMYYVLGDNRRNSFDSHAWGTSCTPQQQCDFVPEENIIGQAWVSYWPWADLGLINNEKIRPQAP